MMITEKCVSYLGFKAKDKVTGAKGMISTVCFDVYGCIQVILDPQKVNKDGTVGKNIGWIDINRVQIEGKKRFFEPPDFNIKYKKEKEIHGPAEKPIP